MLNVWWNLGLVEINKLRAVNFTVTKHIKRSGMKHWMQEFWFSSTLIFTILWTEIFRWQIRRDRVQRCKRSALHPFQNLRTRKSHRTSRLQGPQEQNRIKNRWKGIIPCAGRRSLHSGANGLSLREAKQRLEPAISEFKFGSVVPTFDVPFKTVGFSKFLGKFQ